MVFILPNKRHGLNNLLNKLKTDDLHSILTYKGVSVVKVRIPKFKLTEKVSLEETMSQVLLLLCSWKKMLVFDFKKTVKTRLMFFFYSWDLKPCLIHYRI